MNVRHSSARPAADAEYRGRSGIHQKGLVDVEQLGQLGYTTAMQFADTFPSNPQHGNNSLMNAPAG